MMIESHVLSSHEETTPSTETYCFKYNLDTKARLVGETPPQDSLYKRIKWSPDGSCLMASHEKSEMHLFSLPGSFLPSEKHTLEPFRSFLEGEAIYDFVWYPVMRTEGKRSR